jgi:ligand-binding SRPBCC domain-containing protein
VAVQLVALIRLATIIRAAPERVFDLMRDVDVHQESSSATGERAVAGVTSGLIGMGESVTWRARHLGVWQELTVVVTEFDRPWLFTDEMVRGAFKRMRHVHRFEATPEGTRMTDELDFEAPLGPLGRLAEVLFLTRYMRRFLEARAAFLKARAEVE